MNVMFMRMKEKIKIVDDEVRLPDAIKLHEVSSFTLALQTLLDDELKNDLKRMTAKEVSKKYGLPLTYISGFSAELRVPEILQIKKKKAE